MMMKTFREIFDFECTVGAFTIISFIKDAFAFALGIIGMYAVTLILLSL